MNQFVTAIVSTNPPQLRHYLSPVAFSPLRSAFPASRTRRFRIALVYTRSLVFYLSSARSSTKTTKTFKIPDT